MRTLTRMKRPNLSRSESPKLLTSIREGRELDSQEKQYVKWLLGFEHELIQEVSAEQIEDSCYSRDIKIEEFYHETTQTKPLISILDESNI